MDLKKLYLLPFNNNFSRYEIVETIVDDLKSEFNIFSKNNLIIQSKNQYSDYLLDLLEDMTNIVFIEEPKLRIFERKDSELMKPKNGSFIPLLNSIYLLITTGEPEENEGLPNPILINILSKKEHISERDILDVVFDLIFFQVLSFDKTRLPFLINQTKNKIFRKIPIKYSNVVPF